MRPIPGKRALIAAGMDTMAFNIDLGAAWTEAARTFALDLGTAEVGGLLKTSARVALANVPREVFSVDPLQAATVAAQIEAGTMEIVLRDIGGVDLAVGQYARIQNVRPDEARRAIVDYIRATGATVMTTSPDAAPIMDALARFIETPGNADAQVHAARQSACDAADPGAEDRSVNRGGTIPDRGVDGSVIRSCPAD